MSDAWKPVFEDMKTDRDKLRSFVRAMDWSGGPVSDVGEVLKILPIVVSMVEKHAVAVGTLSGPDKRELAIAVIDDAVRLPGALEWFDDNLAGMLIDAVVAALNKASGTVPAGQSFLDKVVGWLKKLFS